MAPKKPTQQFPSQILLDQFSALDLERWENFEDNFRAYHIGSFYRLETLRHLHRNELLAALNRSTPLSLHKQDWCRIVDYRYSLTPLSAKGSLIRGGRFNVGKDVEEIFAPFPGLYIGESYDASYAEKFATTVIPPVANGLEGYEFSLHPNSFTSVKIELSVENIFDLTKIENLRAFTKIVSEFELTKELKDYAKKLKIKPPYLVTQPLQLQQTFLDDGWRHNPSQLGIPANSQIFAKLVSEAGFQGILYPSTKAPGSKCIIIFPENIAGTDSYVQLVDPSPPEVEVSVLNSETWEKCV